ncbi:Putative xylulose kinase [Ochrobactrum soli]|uniref:Xylulose kinase n=1 Tax=Ochrobactrum soli TaxID=2448455 RepID=A0A2P9HBH8_9HYPH|nr:Putative xylulose kinase [[Ochrobactrum] soli]
MSVEGDILASSTATYALSQPRAGWTEQDPALWIEGARKAVASVMAQCPEIELLCVGLSGQMHGLTPLDEIEKFCVRQSCGTISATLLKWRKSQQRLAGWML